MQKKDLHLKMRRLVCITTTVYSLFCPWELQIEKIIKCTNVYNFYLCVTGLLPSIEYTDQAVSG